MRYRGELEPDPDQSYSVAASWARPCIVGNRGVGASRESPATARPSVGTRDTPRAVLRPRRSPESWPAVMHVVERCDAAPISASTSLSPSRVTASAVPLCRRSGRSSATVHTGVPDRNRPYGRFQKFVLVRIVNDRLPPHWRRSLDNLASSQICSAVAAPRFRSQPKEPCTDHHAFASADLEAGDLIRRPSCACVWLDFALERHGCPHAVHIIL